MTAQVAIIGAGLCGNLLAIMLARQGLEPVVYDRGPPPSAAEPAGGRSINLALAARGIAALEQAGAFDPVESLLLPMDGRIVHELDGSVRFLSYGQYANERIYSVSRAHFNECLYRIAAERWRVEYRFEHECTGFDSERIRARVAGPDGEQWIDADLIVAADGAGSAVRRQLASAGIVDSEEALLDHGYKELSIPPTPAGGFALRENGLHIWPRGGFMLIALPNLDRSFTATLFLPHSGDPGFDRVGHTEAEALFAAEFADAAAVMPDLAADYAAGPIGSLGTVHCDPWVHSNEAGRHVLLIGDAAHAIVPFHGQGMNAAFEDCAVFERLIERHGTDWRTVLPQFEAARRDDCRAIADMALENYAEMRDTVRDPAFERRAALSFELERRFEGRFIPRYSMVMFHPEIGYAEAERRGRIQAEILKRATTAGPAGNETDLQLAARLVEEWL